MTYATQTPNGQVDFHGDSSDIDQYDYEDALERAAIELVASIMGDNNVSKLCDVMELEETDFQALALKVFFDHSTDAQRNEMADLIKDDVESYIRVNWSYSPTEKEFYSND